MIRPMNLSDTSTVYEIDQEELKSNFSLVLYQQELLDLNARSYVYENKGEVVGFIVTKKIGETSDLLQIAVLQSHQKKKIGYELLNHTWKQLTSEGVTEMILEVSVRRPNVVKFYETFGFREIYRRKNYYGMRKDAIVMRLRVE